MRRALEAIGWLFFAIDAVVALALLQWSMSASERDGESAYALVFLLISLVWLALGGGGLAWSARRGLMVGLWVSMLFLALPPLLAVGLRLLHSR